MQKQGAQSIMEKFSCFLSCSSTTDRKLVDIGCGNGDVLAKIIVPKFKKLSKVEGIDISSEMIELAANKYQSDLISFTEVDFGSDFMSTKDKNNLTRIKAEGFDIITSLYCLHWIKNQK
jgi:ubiquinone/menaquinone biosynthesis C-methylase UbiE